MRVRGTAGLGAWGATGGAPLGPGVLGGMGQRCGVSWEQAPGAAAMSETFGGKSRNCLARSEGELKANALIYSLFYLFNYFYSLVECSLFRDVFKDSFDALIFIYLFFFLIETIQNTSDLEKYSLS